MVKERFNGDKDSVDDISKLPISLIRNCVQYMHRKGDDNIPATKRICSIITKHQCNLTEVEFLTIFGETTDKVIGLVLENLYSGDVDVVIDGSGSVRNNEAMDEVDNCILFGMNSV